MNKDDIWNQSLSLLLNEVEADDPKTVFLNMLSPLDIFGDQFVLLADNAAVETWVKNNYLDEIQETISKVSNMPLTVGLGVNTSQKEERDASSSHQPTIQSVQTPSIPQGGFIQNDDLIGESEPDWLNQYVDPRSLSSQSDNLPTPNYPSGTGTPSNTLNRTNNNEYLFSRCTFDTFVVGSSNKFARGAALAVAEQPGVAWNPLFIYGSSGLGKTHLLVAIANYARQNFPHMVTCYVSANDFLNDYVEATQKNQWMSFNKKYHQADILLVDDVQALQGKDETINQLFNIFNEMTNNGKQIVLSADRAPKDIDMDERMRSRFNSGLPVDIKPPDYETRLAIIKNHLNRVIQNTNFYGTIPDEVLAFIAEAQISNIRDVESLVTHLVGKMNSDDKDIITVEEAQDYLHDFLPSAKDQQVTIEMIQSEVERFFEISHEDMISSKRSKNIATARHIAVYLSRYMTEESLQAIGKKFGNRDHTTVMHSVSTIEERQKENRNLFDQVEQLRLIIKKRG